MRLVRCCVILICTIYLINKDKTKGRVSTSNKIINILEDLMILVLSHIITDEFEEMKASHEPRPGRAKN